MTRPPVRRPRLLAVPGALGLLYALTGLIVSWSTLVALGGAHDDFVSAVRKDPARMLGMAPGVSTPDEQQRVAERKAEALWSRRAVLLPLAAANAITSVLVLLGVVRAVARRSRRRGWGRQAWQLGLLIWLPCLVLETLTGWLHSRDLVAALADLHDPLSERLREGLALRDRLVLAQASLSALYLAGTAAYLGTRAVRSYCSDEEAPSA